MKKNFVWGAATAAYQIEGGYREDGKGESIWDVFTHEEGKILRNATGDVACDHYHRYKEDVALMAELGINGYRFSVSWPRIFPDGTGKVNEKGAEFYEKLIDELLSRGIEPYMTLYHWDLPQKLFERGGWLNPDSPKWFGEYARFLGERFGKKVKNFITINEPQCVLSGMCNTEQAPGMKYTLKDRLSAAHNLLKAHGAAVKALRSVAADARIGYAPCGWVMCPKDDSPEEIERACKAYFSMWKNDPTSTVAFFSDPVMLGDYPAEYYEWYKEILPDIREGDLELISQPIDFYCQNIYSGTHVSFDKDGNVVWEQFPSGSPLTAMDWEIVPEALYWGPKFLYERYGKPILITENGMANPDCVCLDQKVHDGARIDYIARYLRQLRRAEADGVDVRGYFYWSLMDNFEWHWGYTRRFGLIYVDYATQKRTPKDSFYFYQKILKEGGRLPE